MIKHGFSSTPYDRVSWCYDMVAHCYSIGQIRKAKSWHSKYLKTGDRALYAGVGSGNEISGVIRAGVQVVAIDNSNSMINLARSRIVQEGLCADLRLGDIFDHKDVGSYDAVIANFFLNLFPASEIPEVLERLISFLRPGGHLYIGDFASAQKGFNALCRYVYFMPVLAIGRINLIIATVVSRIVIGSVCLELRRACVHQPIRRHESRRLALRAHLILRAPRQMRDLPIRKPVRLCFLQ